MPILADLGFQQIHGKLFEIMINTLTALWEKL
jgi:hypothetical protein